jgi:hypothetical protein
MATDRDLFTQINHAVFDLQAAHYNTADRPLKTLARLLHHSELEEFNKRLTEGVDYEAFMQESAGSGGSMAGSQHLAWPDTTEDRLGLTLIMIDKIAENPEQQLVDIAFHYYYSSSNIDASIAAFVRQVIIPFVRDYKSFVQSHGNVDPTLVLATSNKVFVVHGHDDAAKEGLARFIEKLGLEAIILNEQPDQGRTVIEKFEDSAKEVGFAVVLLTPDDIVGTAQTSDQSSRARQNVVFELGYFAGKLGRGRVCLLRKGNVEMPSDLFGVVYTDMDSAGGWKQRLVGELKAAKLDFDANRMWS